ncbi:diaminobutyrate acetyltransferase [Paremcibacter congregatus]|uniref:L-2,4-diaminobutyric acid acetyltransferase n=1 Tax=Paremcibacter congregatus TaxID=2043170 RepID=A0A2G4YQL3_9PROT|nr:diaminobutyrate acetyltransferase [Paremcibacter congregatus]PHZ84577.1 diaminobutyrate acetyltransferase [Paremcibacter congregatus]QDE28797.1 diaminobutyrate acetyltransferase [Paremcibacter congregatus]
MTNIKEQALALRRPVSEDGAAVFQLIRQCPPLDPNSLYCNLLQCSHFAATSVAAFDTDQLVGFISGYIIPDRPNTLFIWQVAVGETARGSGLATKMLHHIVQRPTCQAVTHMETTITQDNQASWALFERFADKIGAEVTSSVMFDRDTHFAGEHDSEHRVKIGPFHLNSEA